MRLMLVFAGVGSLAVWLVIKAGTFTDPSLVDAPAGAWVGLAYWANDGVFFPPIFDGTHYGGTRFGPLSVWLHAQLAQLTGEYIISGRVLNSVAAMALFVCVAATIRQAGRRWAIAVAWPALLFTAIVSGWLAGIRGEGLPVALQLAGLALLGRVGSNGDAPGRTRYLVAAGLVLGLAPAAKMTGIWGGLAAVTWLACYRRRDLALFVASGLAGCTAWLGIFGWLSDGRLFENWLHFAFAGDAKGTLAWTAPLQGLGRMAVRMWEQADLVATVALPLAAWAFVHDLMRRRLCPFDCALIWVLAVYSIVFANAGVEHNHLIAPLCLLLVVSGRWLTRMLDPHPNAYPTSRRTAGFAIAAAVIVGLLVVQSDRSAWKSGLLKSVERWTTAQDSWGEQEAQRLQRLIAPGERLLSVKPHLPVLLDRQPIVMDFFMFRRIDRTMTQPLIDDVRAGRVEHLLVNVESADPRDGPPGHPLTPYSNRYVKVGRVMGLNHYVPSEMADMVRSRLADPEEAAEATDEQARPAD